MILSFVIPSILDERIYQCVNSVLDSISWRSKDCELIIVVNGPYEIFFQSLLKSFNKQVKLFFTKEKNIAKARNIGIRQARGKFIIHIDSDCVVNRHYTLNLRRHIKKQEFCLARGKINFKPNQNWFSKLNCQLRNDIYSKKLEKCFTPNLIVQRQLYEIFGLFEEKLFYGEDAEWGYRVDVNQFSLLHFSDLIVIHYDDLNPLKTLIGWIHYGIGRSFRMRKAKYFKGVMGKGKPYYKDRQGYHVLNDYESISLYLFMIVFKIMNKIGGIIGFLKWRKKSFQ